VGDSGTRRGGYRRGASKQSQDASKGERMFKTEYPASVISPGVLCLGK